MPRPLGGTAWSWPRRKSRRDSTALLRGRTRSIASSTPPARAKAAKSSAGARIVAEVFDRSPYAEQIFDDLWEHFASPANWRLFEDAANAWRQLAAQGLTLGIASNFDDRLVPILASLPPLDDCRHLFISSRIGWRKPAPEFFAAIVEALGVFA